MVDVELLDQIISASGLKKSYIAERLGITRPTLYKILDGTNYITNRQIDVLCEILNITRLSDKEKIFFKK
jgi:predicted transcriptional regulator